MAYDHAAEVIVLHGGGSPERALDDTWVFDGQAWTNTEARGTGGRLLHAMAYDRARGRLVLYGGYLGRRLADDTWEWDGSAWTRVR